MRGGEGRGRWGGAGHGGVGAGVPSAPTASDSVSPPPKPPTSDVIKTSPTASDSNSEPTSGIRACESGGNGGDDGDCDSDGDGGGAGRSEGTGDGGCEGARVDFFSGPATASSSLAADLLKRFKSISAPMNLRPALRAPRPHDPPVGRMGENGKKA